MQQQEILSESISTETRKDHVVVVSSRNDHTSEDMMSTDDSDSSFSPQDDHVHSSDVTRNRKGNGNITYPVTTTSVYTDDESDDSDQSLEFLNAKVGASIENLPSKDAYISDAYSSHVTSRLSGDISTTTELNGRNILNRKLSNEDFPTEPLLSGSFGETKQEKELLPHFKELYSSSGLDSQEFVANLSFKKTTPVVDEKASHTEETSNPSRGVNVKTGLSSFPTRLPKFHASSLGPWHAMIAYDACVRLCLHAWAKGCGEAPAFLENECTLLRTTFGLQQVLLQSEEELLVTRSSEAGNEGDEQKQTEMAGKMKVQVRKVKIIPEPPKGCRFSSIKPLKLKWESFGHHFANIQSKVSSGWQAVRNVHFSSRRVPANGSPSGHSYAYMQESTQCMKQVSGLSNNGVSTIRSRSSGYEVQEAYSCLLRLKSSAEGETIRVQPGSDETHIFLPDSLGDDLIVEVLDSKGNPYGRVLVEVATISEEQNEKLRWWSIYREHDHELVGKIKLYINYTTGLDENSLKCGSIAETLAYDLVMEVAMKEQNFRQRNLLLQDPWKWLLSEFASYYGVSDAYTKLRYLSYIMYVATPTNDCLSLVYDLLLPVIMKGDSKRTLSHQENRILGEIEEPIEQLFAVVFENYKSLDEYSPSGITDTFRPATGVTAPVLEPAVNLYKLLHDIQSPEAQNNLCTYFQAAAKKRSRQHFTAMDEYLSGTVERTLMDSVTVSRAYGKMKSLCQNIRNEIFTDIEIHNCNILPSFIDLPNLSSSTYSVDLYSRLRSFLVAFPPSGPSRPVTELITETADFQKDLETWNINLVKGGVDAKELFHPYIIIWIQDKRLSLLETCKLDNVKWSGIGTQCSTTPFVDEMYSRIKETLNDFEVIICRWPEYTFALENAIADIEKAVIEALDQHFSDVVAPLKQDLAPKKFGLKYVRMLTKRTTNPYVVPPELGILINSLKRILDYLRPKIEVQLKSRGSCCIPDQGNTVVGERLGEVTVMLRSKYRNYLQEVVEKLVENTRLQNGTKLKKILQGLKQSVTESEIRSKMKPLTEQLTNTMNHLHTIVETHVFIAICRVYWDRMGQDLLSFLENKKENKSMYKSSRLLVSILDETFALHMQKLLGDVLQEKDLEPPRSIIEVRSILCKDTDTSTHKKNI